MALILPYIGAERILKAYFNDERPVIKDLTLKLYTNNYTPINTSVAGNFTEASGGGYAAKTLTCGAWTISGTPRISSYGSQTFTFTGAIGGSGKVYGFFVVDDEDNLVYAEKFSDTFTPLANGDMLLINPRLSMGSGTPS